MVFRFTMTSLAKGQTVSKLSPKKFNLEDFRNPPEWLGQFLSNINQFIGDVYQASQNNFTVADNLRAEIKEINFVNDSSNFPLKIKTKFLQNPKGIQVIYCLATDGSTSSNYPWFSWSYDNGQLSITNITNLTASKTYSIRILIIYE